MNRTRTHRLHRAFTILELLVVIAIIAVLLAILLPVLGAARKQVRMVMELSAARQLSTAYISYALEHDGRLLPGYADGPATDGRGHTVSSPANYRYPWRLAPYLGHQVRGGILVNEQERLWRDYDGAAPSSWYYRISVFPSFGLNIEFLGGNRISGSGLNLHMTKLTHAAQPSRLIVFGSSRYNVTDPDQHGYHEIRAPIFPLASGGWADEYDEEDSAYRWGFVHPRWDGRAVFGFLDGHAGTLDTTEMQDMTRWSNQAAEAGDPDWTPSLPQ